MGLDVYVGSLARYYAGEWETILQQSAIAPVRAGSVAGDAAISEDADLARKNAEALIRLKEAARKIGAEVIGPGDRPALSDAERRGVQRGVAAWRKRLTKELKRKVPRPLDWEEDPRAPYFTDKPGWEGYVPLALWAAYDDHPELPRPTTVAEDWTADPAWRGSKAEGLHTCYEQLLRGPEVWLPVDFSFTLDTVDVGGKRIVVGASQALLRELRLLNERTWRAEAATLEQWRQDGPSPRGPLEPNARFGLSVFLCLCEQSVAHRLPMKLDY